MEGSFGVREKKKQQNLDNNETKGLMSMCLMNRLNRLRNERVRRKVGVREKMNYSVNEMFRGSLYIWNVGARIRGLK